MKKITIDLKDREYDIYIEKGILNNINKYLDTKKQTVIITDDFIPTRYLNTIKPFFKDPLVFIVPMGEHTKNIHQAYEIINRMIENNIDRSAQVIALGGGVIGDLSGFIASVYLRGIKFIQIPTTLLSQVDSSIGGKVAVNADKMKNAIGNFYQPQAVIIDPLTLETLDERQISNGMGELIKHGAIFDKELFYDILDNDIFLDIESYIYRSLLIKKEVVIKDELDHGVRQLLNFGHTIGHAIEAYYNFEKYFHGEAIGIGMVKITKDNKIRNDLINIFKKYNIPYEDKYEKEKIYNLLKTDKKIFDGKINLVLLEEIGKSKLLKTDIENVKEYL